MNVEAAEPRCIENRLWQDQPIGGDHSDIEIERGEGCLFLGVLERNRVADRNSEGLGALLDQCRLQCLTAAGWPRRLAISGYHVVAGGDQRFERRDGEIGSTHESNAHDFSETLATR